MVKFLSDNHELMEKSEIDKMFESYKGIQNKVLEKLQKKPIEHITENTPEDCIV